MSGRSLSRPLSSSSLSKYLRDLMRPSTGKSVDFSWVKFIFISLYIKQNFHHVIPICHTKSSMHVIIEESVQILQPLQDFSFPQPKNIFGCRDFQTYDSQNFFLAVELLTGFWILLIFYSHIPIAMKLMKNIHFY